jgi:hypothetical protein
MCGTFIDAQHASLHELVRKQAPAWASIARVVLFDWTTAGDTIAPLIKAWAERPMAWQSAGAGHPEYVLAHSASGFLVGHLPLGPQVRCIMIGVPQRDYIVQSLATIAQRDQWSDQQKQDAYAQSPLTAGTTVPLMSFSEPRLAAQMRLLENLLHTTSGLRLPPSVRFARASVDPIASHDEVSAGSYTVLEDANHDLGSILRSRHLEELWADAATAP